MRTFRRVTLVLFMFMFMLALSASATRRHRVLEPILFVPTEEAALEQTRVSEEFGLGQIRNSRELARLVKTGDLVPLSGKGLRIDPRLPRERRYVRPWTLALIQELAQGYVTRFDTPLTVTSAVRPMSVQRRLLRWNRNAAPTKGDHASSHMTGATVDITRRGMTREQKLYLEETLLTLTVEHRVIVFEERGQPCFHIFTIPTRAL